MPPYEYRIVYSCYFVGAGAVKLAEVVLKAAEQPVEFKFLYDLKVCIVLPVSLYFDFIVVQLRFPFALDSIMILLHFSLLSCRLRRR